MARYPRFPVLKFPLGIVQVGHVASLGGVHLLPSRVTVPYRWDNLISQAVLFKFTGRFVLWRIRYQANQMVSCLVPFCHLLNVRGLDILFWLCPLKYR